MKVQVEVNKGNDVAILSYEAPDDSQVGDVGTVPMFVRGIMQEVVYPGLEDDLAGAEADQ